MGEETGRPAQARDAQREADAQREPDAGPSELIDAEVVVLAAEDGAVYAFRAGQLEAFRVPDEDTEELLAATGAPEVAGFSLRQHGSLRLVGTATVTPNLHLPGDALLPPVGSPQPDVAFPGDTF